MFKNTKAFSGFAVPDIEAARQFYGDVLGIETSEEYGLLTLHLDGGARPTLAYPKPDHEPASYTILNFPVDDIDAAVDALTERGVEILRYDEMPQDERGIMREEGPYIAWFADPAGNVLSVLQER
jgi:predicted enzyme related to lactoylglutathione lyase